MTQVAKLALREITCVERDEMLLDRISLEIGAGAVRAVIATDPAACPIIADLVSGFRRPQHGTIELDGRDLALRGPGRRGVMSIRADLALFPGMTGFANIAFPLEQHQHAAAEIKRRVETLAAEIGISAADLGRKPAEMAPEIRCRVALARAIAAEPQVLVLERPLASLSVAARLGFLPEMRRLLQQFGLTTLLVTDDLHEAMILAQEMSVVVEGHEVQSGPAEAIYKRPVNATVARLAGACNLLAVKVETSDGQIVIMGAMLQGGRAELPRDRQSIGVEQGDALLMVRPEAVRLFLGIRRFDVLAEGIIADVIPHGNGARIRVALDRHPQGMLADVPLPAPMPLEIGRRATVGWNRADLYLLPPEFAR